MILWIALCSYSGFSFSPIVLSKTYISLILVSTISLKTSKTSSLNFSGVFCAPSLLLDCYSISVNNIINVFLAFM